MVRSSEPEFSQCPGVAIHEEGVIRLIRQGERASVGRMGNGSDPFPQTWQHRNAVADLSMQVVPGEPARVGQVFWWHESLEDRHRGVVFFTLNKQAREPQLVCVQLLVEQGPLVASLREGGQ